MNAQKQNLHDFLVEHINDTVDTHDSVVEILCDHFSESIAADSPRIRECLARLREQLAESGVTDAEPIMNIVFELCTRHQECGFQGGLDMGIALAKELSSIR